ncbi:MAG: hypothetical protein R6T98_09230 [Desulfatiglandales bacterium]
MLCVLCDLLVDFKQKCPRPQRRLRIILSVSASWREIILPVVGQLGFKTIGKVKNMEYIEKMIKRYKEVSHHGTDYY